MPLVELANGVAVNTAHVTQMKIVDAYIAWRLTSDGPAREVALNATARDKLSAAFPPRLRIRFV